MRPAGLNERRCIARDVSGLYGTIVTAGRYRASSGSLEEHIESIRQAVQICVEQHPALSFVVKGSQSPQPFVERAPSVDLRQHLEVMEGNGLENVLSRAHKDPLSDYEARPQWKVYVLPLDDCFYIGFATSHVLADGMSGILLHTTFLNALRGHRPGAVRSELPPAIEQAAKLPLSWSFFLRTLGAEFLPFSLQKLLGLPVLMPGEAWFGAAVRPELPAQGQLINTSITTVFVPPETLRGMLGACRTHGCRLSSLLTHLTARAVKVALRGRGREYTRFLSETAINLRRCVPQAADQVANYASAINEVHTVEIGDLSEPLTEREWTAVARSTGRLAAASNSLADQAVTLLKYVSDIPVWVRKRATTPPRGSFAVSNLGSFDPGAGGGEGLWSVDQMVFSQSADGTGWPFNINFASVKDGPLAVVITWWPGMLGVDNEEAFVGEICHGIELQADALA